MSEKFQLKGGLKEPSSDISLNWRDMRSEFGYKLLDDICFVIFFKTKEVTMKW